VKKRPNLQGKKGGVGKSVRTDRGCSPNQIVESLRKKMLKLCPCGIEGGKD